MVKFFVFSFALVCFGSFTWALQRLFVKSPHQKNMGIRLIYIFGTVFTLTHLILIVWLYQFDFLATLLGCTFYSVALGLFWWAVAATRSAPLTIAFSNDVPSSIIKSGPYRIIRHPFYTSYTLAWLAGVIVLQMPVLLITAIIMFFLYWFAAHQEEKKFNKSALAKAYLEYQRSVGMFLPKIL